MIGLIAPLQQEASILTKARIKRLQVVPLNDRVILVISGVGPKNAEEAAHLLGCKATHLISWGTAAGLQNNLLPGTLVLPNTVIDQHANSFKTDANFNNSIAAKLPEGSLIDRGVLAESSLVLENNAQKDNFASTTKAVAADMESATIGRIAGEYGLKFNALRVVTDDISSTVPSTILNSINQDGELNMRRFMQHLALHPSEWRDVYRVSRSFLKASETLKKVGAMLLNEKDF